MQVESICTVLTKYGIKIAPRSYRAAKTRPISARAKSDANITALMTAWRDTPDDKGRLPRERFYGCRKMRALLARHGIDIGLDHVRRLMRQAGMRGLVRGRPIRTTTKTTPTAGDLVNRVFTAPAPNRLWVTDMTYVKLSTGSWVYVTFMTDAYARKIVACHAAATMTRQLVTDTLKLAIEARALEGHPVEAGLIHHSDHESQYTAIHYGEQLVIEGIVPSFGSVGDAYDNALAETINGLYKTECVTQDGPFHTIDQVMDATLDWAHWWNNQRLLERLDYQTPVEIETQYYENQKSPENE